MRPMRPGVALLLLVLACGDGAGPSKPEPGTLVADLVTPAGTEGAVVVTITGPGITAVSAARTTDIVHSRTSATGVKVAVFGTLPAGALLRFNVPNVKEPRAYAATVLEAAGTNGALRESLTGYSVTFRRE